MAKETNDSGQASQQPIGSSNTSVESTGQPTSQTEDCINKYIEDRLVSAVKSAENQEQVSCFDYGAEVEASKYKICSYLQILDVFSEYRGIKNCVSVNLKTHANHIKENVAYCGELTGEIDKALNESLDAIKALKNKMSEVRDAACKLEAARTDSCHSEQLKALKKLPEKDQVSGLTRFTNKTDDIIGKSESLYNIADDLFEKGVKVAGILAFMNINSLTELTAVLNGYSIELDEDVEGNLKHFKDKAEECAERYTEQLATIGGAYYVKNQARIKHLSLLGASSIFEVISDADCSVRKNGYPQLNQQLSDICDKYTGPLDIEIDCKDSTGGVKFE